MSRVFRSYAVKDSAKVDLLQRELGQRGIDVWRDKDGTRKHGYETRESYATLGNENMTFTPQRAR